MTRATEHPLYRVVAGERTDYVAEITEFNLTLRPKRSRRHGAAAVTIPWGQLYVRLVMKRPYTTKRRKITRGLLTTRA